MTRNTVYLRKRKMNKKRRCCRSVAITRNKAWFQCCQLADKILFADFSEAVDN